MVTVFYSNDTFTVLDGISKTITGPKPIIKGTFETAVYLEKKKRKNLIKTIERNNVVLLLKKQFNCRYHLFHPPTIKTGTVPAAAAVGR